MQLRTQEPDHLDSPRNTCHCKQDLTTFNCGQVGSAFQAPKTEVPPDYSRLRRGWDHFAGGQILSCLPHAFPEVGSLKPAVKSNPQHKAESTGGERAGCKTQLTQQHRAHSLGRTTRASTSTQGGRRTSLVAEHTGRKHQHGQTTGGENPHNFRTYLHPLPIDLHEEDAEGVGFGSDIPVQKVLAADGQLDFADTVLGADGPRRRGGHGVRHGLQQQQQLQVVCGT